MSYIGQIPSTTFLQKQSQSFTPDGSTTSFTLDFSVTNEKDLLVVVNNVIQEPGDGKAYTASDNTLLMSAAPASGDTMYCYYLGFTVGTINTPDGSVTKAKTNFITDTTSAGVTSKGSGSQAGQIQLNCSANSHGIKLESPPHAVGQSYTLIYPDNNVTAGTVMAVDSISGSGTTATGSLKFKNINAPAFLAYQTGAQAISNASNVKIEYNTELFDTDGMYDHSTNYRFTPTVAGKYVVGAKIKFDNCASSRVYTMIYKNGSEYERSEKRNDSSGTDPDPISNLIIDFNGSSDYVEVYGRQESGGSINTNVATVTRMYFFAYKLNV
jgi:hypothetical protein